MVPVVIEELRPGDRFYLGDIPYRVESQMSGPPYRPAYGTGDPDHVPGYARCSRRWPDSWLFDGRSQWGYFNIMYGTSVTLA